MTFAAEGGHQQLVELFILKGANCLNQEMYGAARGDYKELVEFLIEKGANNLDRE